VGDYSHYVFRQKLLGEDGSVRRCVTIVKQSGVFSPKFEATSSRVYTRSPKNVWPVVTNLLCTIIIILMSKKVMIMLLTLLFNCLAYLALVTRGFSTERKTWGQKNFLITVRVSVAFFPRLAQNFMHTRCSFFDPPWKSPQVTYPTANKRVWKLAHVHSATCNLAHWPTRHGSPTIYRCFALPQLLYRWRHQSGIFLTPPRTNQGPSNYTKPKTNYRNSFIVPLTLQSRN
jgi:hypothetical protein